MKFVIVVEDHPNPYDNEMNDNDIDEICRTINNALLKTNLTVRPLSEVLAC